MRDKLTVLTWLVDDGTSPPEAPVRCARGKSAHSRHRSNFIGCPCALSELRSVAARSAHRSQLGKAGLERPYQRVDLRFGHRRGERARPRADDDATFVVEVIEQRLESARLASRQSDLRVAVSSQVDELEVQRQVPGWRATGRAAGQTLRL